MSKLQPTLKYWFEFVPFLIYLHLHNQLCVIVVLIFKLSFKTDKCTGIRYSCVAILLVNKNLNF